MGPGNNDFKFFLNEGSSFLLICFILTVITHAQELLYSLLHSFILAVQAFLKGRIQDKKNQLAMQKLLGFDGFALRLPLLTLESSESCGILNSRPIVTM